MTHSLDQVYQRRQRKGLAGKYSYFNPAHLYMVQQRQRATLKLLQENDLHMLDSSRILEVGCGSGGILHEFLAYGARADSLHGVDLLGWRLVDARSLLPAIELTCADGQRLPYENGTFDLVLQHTVFSSILDTTVKRRVADEMRRVVRASGAILWYDYWLNPVNADTHGVRLREVRQLFNGATLTVKRITLAPPLIRLLAARSWIACLILEKMSLFNTHYLVLIRG